MDKDIHVIYDGKIVEILAAGSRAFRILPAGGIGVVYKKGKVYRIVDGGSVLILKLSVGYLPKGACPICRNKVASCTIEKGTKEPDLSRFTLQELAARWRNCVERLQDPSQFATHDMALKHIEEIEALWFRWPTTHPPSPGGGAPPFFPYEEGILSFLGYRVGNTNGIAEHMRRAILSRAVEGILPPLNDWEYMEGWGKPKTINRLRKLVYTIHSFRQNALNNRTVDMSFAIAHWGSDLNYARQEYYNRYGPFEWPRV